VEGAVAVGAAHGGPGRAQKGVPISWNPNHELDIHEWATAGRRIGAVGRSVQWLLGDWLAYGSLKFGERYPRAAKITGYDIQTLMNMVYVASRFPISRRREKLSWSHHEAVAAQKEEDQDHWLDQAIEHRWSVADLRMMLRSARRKKDADQESEEIVPSKDLGISATELTIKCPRCGEKVSLSA
jgi:hypothetical protein